MNKEIIKEEDMTSIIKRIRREQRWIQNQVENALKISRKKGEGYSENSHKDPEEEGGIGNKGIILSLLIISF